MVFQLILKILNSFYQDYEKRKLKQFTNNMTTKEIATGMVHKVPADLQQALINAQKVRIAWNNLTPLARNEWICLVTSVKKPETRKEHIKRVCAQLLEDKRRPCCWPGCPHR